MSKKYVLNVPEVHHAEYVVYADSEVEALEKFENDEAEYVSGSLEYSHILDSSEIGWGVKQDGGNQYSVYRYDGKWLLDRRW